MEESGKYGEFSMARPKGYSPIGRTGRGYGRNIYLSPVAWEVLEKLAEAAGLSVSAYLELKIAVLGDSNENSDS